MRQLGVILSGIAFVYVYQKSQVEKAAKVLLSDLNGDSLWSEVQKRRPHPPGAQSKPRPKVKLNVRPLTQYERVMDVKMLLDLTTKRLDLLNF